MQQTSKWEMKIGKEFYILSGDEKEAVVNAGQARFVKFRDMVINPAYVERIKLIEGSSAPRLPAPPIQVQNADGKWEDWRPQP